MNIYNKYISTSMEKKGKYNVKNKLYLISRIRNVLSQYFRATTPSKTSHVFRLIFITEGKNAEQNEFSF
jgi:hypothetical protein